MMDEYYNVAAHLPEPYGAELAQLDPALAGFVQEIRLRADQPLLFTVKGRAVPCFKLLPCADACRHLDAAALRACFLALCRHSVYAHEEELAQGYLTLEGGHRVGVAGVRAPAGFSAVTTLNLRVARRIVCPLPASVCRALDALSGGILVAGAPGSGKTTVLRSMIEYLGRQDKLFSVVDERGELLGATCRGLPPAPSAHCDVYTHFPRAQGILMALRTMNPQAIVCDELGSREDALALEAGLASGAVFLASVHCTAGTDAPLDALRRRPLLARLLDTGAFDTVLLLDGRERPGTVSRTLSLDECHACT